MLYKKYIPSFRKDIPILWIITKKSMYSKWVYKELLKFTYLLTLMFCIFHQKIHQWVVCGSQNGLTWRFWSYLNLSL